MQQYKTSQDGDLLIGDHYIITRSQPQVLLKPSENKDLWNQLGGTVDSNGIYIIPKGARYGLTKDNVPYVKLGNYYFTSNKISDSKNNNIIPILQDIYKQYKSIADKYFNSIDNKENSNDKSNHDRNTDPTIINAQKQAYERLSNYYNENKNVIDNYTTSNEGQSVYLDIGDYNKTKNILDTFNKLRQFSEDTNKGKYNSYLLSQKLTLPSLFNLGTGGTGGILNTYASFGGFGLPLAFASNVFNIAGRNRAVYDINNNIVDEFRESLPVFTPTSFVSNLINSSNNNYYLTGEAPSLTGNQYGDMAIDLFTARRPGKISLKGASRGTIASAIGTGTAYAFDNAFDAMIGGEAGRTASVLTQQALFPALSKTNFKGRKINGIYNPLWYLKHRVIKPYQLKHKDPLIFRKLAHQKYRINSEIINNRYNDELSKVHSEVNDKLNRIDDNLNLAVNHFTTQENIDKINYRQKLKHDLRKRNTFFTQLISQMRSSNLSDIASLLRDVNEKSSKLYQFYDPILNKITKGLEPTHFISDVNLDHPWHPILKNLQMFSVLHPDKDLSLSVSKYITNLQNRLLDQNGIPNGIVAGSSVLKANGLMSGIPHDVELITTESRLPQLKSQLYGTITRNLGSSDNPGLNFGVNIKSRLVFGDSGTDVQIIKERNGKAYGAIARELYMVLDPEGYYRWTQDLYKQAVENNAKTEKTPDKLDRINSDVLKNTDIDYATLPVSAEQIYRAYAQRPDLILTKTILDQLSSVKDKHVDRSSAMFLNHSDIVENALNIQSIANTGKPIIYAKDMFPNLDLSSIGERKDFLKSINMDPNIASNDKAFNLVLARWLEHNTLALRSSRVFTKDVPYHATLTTALGGGTASGIGGNAVLVTYGMPAIGSDITHLNRYILTHHPEKVKSLLDLVVLTKGDRDRSSIKFRQTVNLDNISKDKWESLNQKYGINVKDELKKHIHSSTTSLYDLFDNINRKVNFGYEGFVYEPIARKLNHALSELYDVPFYRNTNAYNGDYIGALYSPIILNRAITGYPNVKSSEYKFFEFGKFPDGSSTNNFNRKINQINARSSKIINTLNRLRINNLGDLESYKNNLYTSIYGFPEMYNKYNLSFDISRKKKQQTIGDIKANFNKTKNKVKDRYTIRTNRIRSKQESDLSNLDKEIYSKFLSQIYHKYPLLRPLFEGHRFNYAKNRITDQDIYSGTF